MKARFDHATYFVFGLTVHHKKIVVGDTYKVVVPQNMPASALGNKTLFTKGRITGVGVDGAPLLYERVPGFNTMSDRAVPAGQYTFTAQEDSEWWCVNAAINERAGSPLPTIEVFNLKADQQAVLPVGTKLLLCEGRCTIGEREFASVNAIQLDTAAITATAVVNCYGLIFKD